jgi:H+/Cl- antiporter ClcA
VPAATEALMVRGGHIRGRVGPLKLLATTATVGLGGSAGREGPISTSALRSARSCRGVSTWARTRFGRWLPRELERA